MDHGGHRVIEPGSVSEDTWQKKYRYWPSNGSGGDVTPLDMHRRVARWLASAEAEPQRWELAFLDAMRNWEFIPAGRILAGAGTNRDVTACNCFVMGTIEDSLDGIYSALREAALTLKAGGGIGMDFSTLRPRGAVVRGVDSVSSGAVSFMASWHTMCGTIISAGARRGAMMGTLRCDHPDIEEFIDAKRQPGRLTNFNLSVLVTDAFMSAVDADAEWPLSFGGTVYKMVRARELWDRITRSTYDYAEPGVIFIDKVNARNPLNYCETIYSSNPCGEQILPPYGACILGSINLARLVRNSFEESSTFDFDRLDQLVDVAVRALDNVVTLSKYPLPQQRQEADAKRRIGLGITGLADALIMMGIRYGGDAAVEVVSDVMQGIRKRAEFSSVLIGEEKGSFPLFSAEHYGVEHRRNSHLLSIAPTGTISLVAGNVSGGIEPVFGWSFQRNILQADGTRKTVRVEDYAYRLAREMGKPTTGPEWVTAAELGVAAHIDMVAAAQEHVDAGISKTINCASDMGFDAFQGVYRKAYDQGLKGCTTYRPNANVDAVLVADVRPAAEAPAVQPVPVAAGNVVRLSEPLARPEVLHGSTYKIKPGGSEHALYVTINDVEVGGRRRPFELFLASKEADGYPWRVALARALSAVFRKGGEVGFLADELKQVFDPRGGWWEGGKLVASQPAAIGLVLERHMRGLGLIEQAEVPIAVAGRHCPKCQTGRLIFSEGCHSCDSCDYTKC